MKNPPRCSALPRLELWWEQRGPHSHPKNHWPQHQIRGRETHIEEAYICSHCPTPLFFPPFEAEEPLNCQD